MPVFLQIPPAGADHLFCRDLVYRVKLLGISTEKNTIRINSAGCMNRCDDGPVIVVYPEGTWYTYVDQEDLDEIIEEHLKNGRVVERLKI